MGLECCRSFTTHYQKLCFELESRALATWKCLPFCHIHMLTTSWKDFCQRVLNSLVE
jgi:hypothetical protein